MKRISALIPILFAASMTLTQCGREAVSNNNLEQIYKEQGVPVKVEAVEPKIFEVEIFHHAVLSGIEESSVHATVSDVVKKVHVSVGDFVKKGQVLLSFPQNTISANYEQKKIAYENAKVTYERIKQFYESGGVSKQELDNTKAAYDVAAADWDAVGDMIDVKAPIEGYVTSISVSESDTVLPGELLMTVSKIDRMKAKIWVSDGEIGSIRKGQRATAVWNGMDISGKVVQVDMAMDKETKAFGVVLEFGNPDRILKVGVVADVRVIVYSNPAATVIERKNMMSEGGRPYVFVARDGAAEKRSVSLGKEQGLDVEILDGLQRSDLLITEGQLLLEQGSKIKIVN